MQNKEIFNLIEKELVSATKKWPNYYSDVIHATALINEESGESIQAALDLTYDNGSIDDLKSEVIQTAAMCFRLLNNIDNLKTPKQLM